MTTIRTRALGAAGVLALAATGLAACAGGPGGQSVDAACGVIQDEFERIGTEMEESMASVDMSDPSALETAFEQLDAFLGELEGVEEQVTNEEVSEPFSTVVDGLEASLGSLELLGDLDFTDPEAMAELEEKQAEIEGKVADMEEATATLEELCGFEA